MVQSCLVFLGRFCLSLVFLSSVLAKFFDWHGTEQHLVFQLRDLATLSFNQPMVQEVVNYALAYPGPLLAIGAALELFGSLSLLLGMGTRLGAFFLVLFLIPTTIIGHHFWLLSGNERELQMVMFLKNISILGGLFLVIGMKTGSVKPKKE